MTTLDVSTPHHVCPKCQQEKPLTIEFWCLDLRTNRNPWVKYACRLCRNVARRETSKAYTQSKRSTDEGRIASNAAMREWKRKNRTTEKRREEYRKLAENKGKQYFPRGERQKDRQFIEQEYDKIIERNARAAFNWWFAKKTDEQVAAWYAAAGKPWLNPRLSDAEAWKLKYDNDPEFHAYEVMRRQLKKHLYKDGIGDLMRQQLNTQGRSNIVEKLLGYTIHDLRVHLERQFTKGMNWDKFMKGEIHIDHIHPKASFDLLDSDEWRVCWSLPNLRPLWAKDNQKKHAKVLSLL